MPDTDGDRILNASDIVYCDDTTTELEQLWSTTSSASLYHHGRLSHSWRSECDEPIFLFLSSDLNFMFCINFILFSLFYLLLDRSIR
jgi:hypothetical protein